MKTTVKAIAVFLFSLPLLANAGGKISTGSMQVSFVVKESCNVQASSAKAPSVACQLNTPYQMTRAADRAATSDSALAIRTENAAQDWTVTF